MTSILLNAGVAEAVSHLNIEGLITDLAFILILGAIVTLLFKWIKQPVVLGYIVAGFLASPNFTPLPSVANEANIEFWAQLGIIVLLYSLGLEFSFKKLLNAGGSAVVTALIIVAGMMSTGFVLGTFMGFSMVNSLFLGGMLSMSSTTIILKALTDLGLRQKRFASQVLAVLIIEDLFAVVMMVV
ncbi:MAG: cation:proton antiporter, partial [Muribaculaceae bacterium]|nr:cation:proton antiporter [Muribaculaceae bacterium]